MADQRAEIDTQMATAVNAMKDTIENKAQKEIGELKTAMEAMKDHIMNELRETKQQLQEAKDRSEEYDHDMAGLDNQCRDIQQELKKEKDKNTIKKKQNLVNNKSFKDVPKYGGKHCDYDNWKFKMTRFLSETEQFPEVMNEFNKFKKEPGD